jgi:hypothetical protein
MCAEFIMSYDVFILSKMGHPDVRWSVVSSCFLHSRNLQPVSSFKVFLKTVRTECLILHFLSLPQCLQNSPIGRTVLHPSVLCPNYMGSVHESFFLTRFMF